MIGSPGTGVQHFATRTSTSSTPFTLMPTLSLAAGRALEVLSGIASSSATSVVFRRWITFLTIWLGWSFPEPSAT
jgi:hypothetical protein